MLDFLYRAALKPFDYIKICNRRQIEFAKSSLEGDGVYSFEFKAPDNLNWKAGQHGVFVVKLDRSSEKNWRPFSICSSSAEGVIKIATNIAKEHSNFKDKLLKLRTGDKIILYGPLGEFYPKKQTKKIIGVAGGIGITPFRSIAYEIYHDMLPKISLELIYGGKNDFFAFKEEFDLFNQHPNINIIYKQSADEVNGVLEKLIKNHSNSADYFISGSPGMISAIQQKLVINGIKRITTDPFKGY